MKLNSTRSTLLKVDCCWKSETGNKSATKSTVVDTVDYIAGFSKKSATTWIRQFAAVDFVADTVDFVADTVDVVADMVDFVADMVDFVADMVDFVADMVDVVASVCTEPKQHGQLCRLSTKWTVLNSTFSPVCTGL